MESINTVSLSVVSCCVHAGGNIASVGRIGGMDTSMSSLSFDQIQAADFTFLKKLMDLRKVLKQQLLID